MNTFPLTFNEIHSSHIQSNSSDIDLSFLSKYFVSLPVAISSLVKHENETSGMILENDYQPADCDVLCGRGKGFYNRIGNKIFRSVVSSYKDQYEFSKTKIEKSMILDEIIDQVIERNNGQSKFLKYNKKLKCWMEMTREQTREKVGHVIREAVAAGQNPIKKINAKKTCKMETPHENNGSYILNDFVW